MIYEAVPPDAPIRQGDIFRSVPRVDFSMTKLAVLEEGASFSEMKYEPLFSYLKEKEELMYKGMTLRALVAIPKEDCLLSDLAFEPTLDEMLPPAFKARSDEYTNWNMLNTRTREVISLRWGVPGARAWPSVRGASQVPPSDIEAGDEFIALGVYVPEGIESVLRGRF